MLTPDQERDLFAICWAINDALHLTADGGVDFEGSVNEVEDFRALLHRLDPNFTRGLTAAERRPTAKESLLDPANRLSDEAAEILDAASRDIRGEG